MKKAVFSGLIALLIVLLCAGAASAEGAWELKAYVDEFNLPTKEYYFCNASPCVGSFSNSATTESELYAYVQVDFQDCGVSIKLIEYGSIVVKNSFSSYQDYDVAMLDAQGNKTTFEGTMYSGTDHIDFVSRDSAKIVAALSQGGIVRFSITEKDRAVSRYIFATPGFEGLIELFPYRAMGSFHDGLAEVKKGGLCGYVDTTGRLAIPYMWEEVTSFSDGLARVNKDGAWGIIDTAGNLVVPCVWPVIYGFHDGLAKVDSATQYERHQYGYIDTSGNLVSECQWEEATDFSEGFARVKSRKTDKWGIIDTKGNLLVPCEYDVVYPFIKGVAFIGNKHDSTANPYSAIRQYYYEGSLIDTRGKTIRNVAMPLDKEDPRDPDEDLILVLGNYDKEKERYRYGYVNYQGEFVISYEKAAAWDIAKNFRDGLALVWKIDDEKESYVGKFYYGFIDKTGKLVVPFRNDWLPNEFSEGRASVTVDNNAGYMDTTGKIVIPSKWFYAEPFHFGVAKVTEESDKDKWGLINPAGEFLTPCQWDEIEVIFDGLIRVKKGDKFGLLDMTGREITPCQWSEAEYYDDGYIRVADEDGWRGFIDMSGAQVIPCEYGGAGYGEGYFSLCKGSEITILDRDLNEIVPAGEAGDGNAERLDLATLGNLATALPAETPIAHTTVIPTPVRTPTPEPTQAPPAPSPAPSPTPSQTQGEDAALNSACSYLSFMAFSRSGLIGQLAGEGYTQEEATYAADHCGADWNEQAAKAAANAVKDGGLSSGEELVQRLESYGFTHEQAAYAAKKNGY